MNTFSPSLGDIGSPLKRREYIPLEDPAESPIQEPSPVVEPAKVPDREPVHA